MANVVKIEFVIEAGTYDGDSINWKYIESTNSADEALSKFNQVRYYPVVYFWLQTEYDDNTRVDLNVLGPGNIKQFILQESKDGFQYWNPTDQS